MLPWLILLQFGIYIISSWDDQYETFLFYLIINNSILKKYDESRTRGKKSCHHKDTIIEILEKFKEDFLMDEKIKHEETWGTEMSNELLKVKQIVT